tara:strand:+ start:239 stop:604 length:366 start_codon:yes stop_codon:yes gene_type:complete
MPSQRKRIGFLPSEEVHEIIDKLCKTNNFSQSKVTGLLVEEALRSRGIINQIYSPSISKEDYSINYSFEQEPFLRKNDYEGEYDNYKVNKKELIDDIKFMHEFIEFKYFKKVMQQNNNIFE